LHHFGRILKEIFEFRALAALRGSHQDRFITKLRALAKSLSFFSLPAFPLRLALSLCGGDKGRSLSKIPPSKSNIWLINIPDQRTRWRKNIFAIAFSANLPIFQKYSSQALPKSHVRLNKGCTPKMLHPIIEI
jgi:hypothetical protein